MAMQYTILAVIGILSLVSGCSTNSNRGAPVSTAYWASDDLPFDGQYQVLGGDTLSGLSRRFDIPMKDIIRYNSLKSPYTLVPGQNLYLTPKHSRSLTKAYTGVQASKGVTGTHAAAAPLRNTTASQLDVVEDEQLTWISPTVNQISRRFSKDYPAVDYDGDAGDPVKAVGAGEVIYSGSDLKGYGNMLIIKHNNNFLSTYAHNRVLAVQEGDKVAQGQTIAQMGQSGSDHVHLHFEMRYQGEAVDPLKFMQGS